MGLQLRKKDKYRPSRRKFGQACGRRSNSAKKTEKKRVMKAEEKANFYDSDKSKFQFPYYQLTGFGSCLLLFVIFQYFLCTNSWAKIDTCQSGQTRKRQVRRKQKAPKTKPEGHGPQQTPEKVIGLSEPLITDGNEGVSNDKTKIDTCQSVQTDKKKVRSNQKAQKIKPEGHRPQQTHEKVIGLNETPITDGNESVKNGQSKIDTCQSGQTQKTKPEGHGPQQTTEKVIGLNEPPITDGNKGVSNDQSKRRSRRQDTVKFLGRDIRFKGVAVSGERPRWRFGTILDVVRGKDGAADAVYEILYQGDDQSCQVTDVLSNYQKGLLQFTDL